MVKGTATVTSKGDPNVLKKIMADIGQLEVYVGIPEDDGPREKESITNAELAFIHTHGVRALPMREEMQGDLASGTPYSKAYEMYIQEHGSPLWQSPPRPIIEPAIEKHKAVIAKKLSEAAQSALDGSAEEARRKLAIAGGVAANLVQDYFEDPDNGWDPNSEKTVERKGSDKPLIDKGELRKSITYVVGDRQ